MDKKNLVSLPATISEMNSKVDDFKVDVPFASGVDVKTLTEGDKSPLFVTLEAVNTSISKSKRRYTPEVVSEIARQINEIKPDAYEGHLKEEDRAFARPKPQTIWLGAVVKEIEGKMRLFIKGYVLPYAKELKSYLKAAKASSKKVAVSIYGQAKQSWNNNFKAYDVSDFRLESIDWARSGSEGVPSLGLLTLTSEMDNNEIMTREEIVKDLKLSEIKEINPSIVLEMQDELKDELRSVVVDEVKGDYDLELKTVKEMVDSEDVVGTVKEMIDEISRLKKIEANYSIDSFLNKRVSNDSARKVLKSMVIRELSDDYNKDEALKVVKEMIASEEGKAVVREMNSAKNVLNPTVDNRKKDNGRKYTIIK
jgi:hypothetical protein